jgi:hypothetical protein
VKILELTAEGVRGFSSAAKVELPAGYSVLEPSSPDGAPLAGLVSSLLFPDGRGGEAAYLAPGKQSGTVTLMFRGNDQGTYYLARHLGGAGALHRLSQGGGQWELVTENNQEMAEYLRGQIGLPPKSTFQQGFTLLSAQFPGESAKRNANRSRAGSAGAGGAASDVEAARDKLLLLTTELDASEQVEQLQYKLDAATSELADVQSKLAEGTKLKAAVKQAEAACAAAPTPESAKAPADIVERAQRLPQLLAKRDAALAQLEEGRAAEASVRASVDPLRRNPIFWAALSVGLCFFVLGLVLSGAGRYLALLDIPAFGFAALIALRYVDELERVDREARKGQRLAAREKKILADYETEAQWVKKAMHALGTDSPAGLVEIFSQKATLGERAQDLRNQLEAMEKDSYYASLVAKQEELKGQHDALEAALTERGSYAREARVVEREIQRLRKVVESASDPEEASSGPPQTERIEDLSPQVLALAADLLLVDSRSAAELLRDRWGQLFATFTARRYSGVEFDTAGKAAAIGSQGRIQAGELPRKDLDLVYLAGRVALVEKCAGRAKMPLLVESLPDTVGDEALPLIGRVLKHLGALTQVIHVCPNAEVGAMAEALLKL